MVEASGGNCGIGDISAIYSQDAKGQVLSEVIGFKDDKILLMPYESTNGITAGSFVRNTKQRLKIPVGDFLRGRVINALGQPMDGLGDFDPKEFYPVDNTYINPLERPPITEKMSFGVKAIDGMLTIGKGQRVGIFAGSGVGKSTLLGMIRCV